MATNGIYDTISGAYRDIGLPLAGIIEAIATEGKSPGTAAMTQQQILLKGEEARRSREEDARKALLESKLYGYKEAGEQRSASQEKRAQDEYVRKTNEMNLAAKRAEALAARLKGKTDPTEMRNIVLEEAANSGDLESIMKLTKPEGPDFATQLAQAIAMTTAKGKAEAEAPKKMSAPQLEAITTTDRALDQLHNITNLFDPKFVGPVSGRAGTFKDFLGTIGAEEAVFRSAFQEFKNELIKARSGGAVTPQEAVRLEAEISNFNVAPNVYLARLDRAKNTLLDKRKRTIKSYQGANLIVEPDMMTYIPFSNLDNEMSKPKTVTTQAEFDALSSGATYIDAADGKTYKKP